MPVPQPARAAANPTASAAAAHSVVLFGELLADVFPDRRVVGGAPFNVACHLQGFGVPALLATRVGRDEAADFLLAAMRRMALSTALVQFDPAHASGRVEVVPDGAGHRFEIAPDQAFDHIDAAALERAVPRPGAAPPGNGPAPGLLYFGTLAQRHPHSRAALQALLARCPAHRFVDLNLRPPWVSRDICERSLAIADLVKLSEEELAAVAAWNDGEATDRSAQTLGRRVAARYDIGSLFVTCGARGSWCLRDGEVVAAESTPAASGGDSVGAGDAFSAVLILGTLLDWPLPQMLARASRFAGAICGIRGATPEQRDFYRAFIEEWLGG